MWNDLGAHDGNFHPIVKESAVLVRANTGRIGGTVKVGVT